MFSLLVNVWNTTLLLIIAKIAGALAIQLNDVLHKPAVLFVPNMITPKITVQPNHAIVLTAVALITNAANHVSMNYK